MEIKLDPRDHQVQTTPEMQDLIKQMEQAALTQTALGLGRPDLRDSTGYYRKATDQMYSDWLSKEFKAVKVPDKKFFTYFDPDGSNWRATVSAETLPKFAWLRLTGSVDSIRVNLKRKFQEDESFYAVVPIIPPSIQQKAKRAAEICPRIQFHLIFAPSWQPVPVGDPVLVGRVAGVEHWYVIGEWDGDAALIKEFMESK